jgi:hypothetical protein
VYYFWLESADRVEIEGIISSIEEVNGGFPDLQGDFIHSNGEDDVSTVGEGYGVLLPSNNLLVHAILLGKIILTFTLKNFPGRSETQRVRLVINLRELEADNLITVEMVSTNFPRDLGSFFSPIILVLVEK